MNPARFWNKTAYKYAQKPVPDIEKYKQKLSETSAYLNKEMRVLEFGCGTGESAIHHSANVHSLEAIDISENMIDIARAKAEKKGIKNLTFTVSDLHGFQAKPESFDAVLALNVLHLLPNRVEVLDEVRRVLKPDGVFVSSTGCLGNSYLKYLKYLGLLARPFGLMPALFAFTESQLTQEITAAGFTIKRRWHHGFQNSTVFIIAQKLQRV